MFENFIEEMWFLFQVSFAMLLGFLIGLERKTKYKEAGIRTHAIVCASGTLMMIISKFGFEGESADKSRVAAQIVSGIGFLGAGIIVYRKQALRGLTTAAGIWMTAGIGMAVGADMYYLASGATLAVIGLHLIMNLPFKILKTKRFFHFKIKFIDDDNESKKIKDLFKIPRFSKVNYIKKDGKIEIIVDLYTSDSLDEDKLKLFIETNENILSVERIVE